jgi:hypothetical protein
MTKDELADKEFMSTCSSTILTTNWNQNMKVQELLTEAFGRAGPTEKKKRTYKPGYDAEKKVIVGDKEDWLARLDGTADDVVEARAKAMKLPSYKKLVKKAHDITNAREMKNGSFAFEHPGTETYDEAKYTVTAMGQIRVVVPNATGRQVGTQNRARLASPKPRVVYNDPVASLVSIYDGAFKEIIAKLDRHSQPSPVSKRMMRGMSR